MAEARPEDRASSDVRAGTLAGVFGLRGELKLDPTRSGTDALARGRAVRLRLPDGSVRGARIASLRRHGDRLLVRFDDIATVEAAAALVRAEVLVAQADVPLRDGEYFDTDLIGCRVVGIDDRDYGEVVDVLHYPAQDLVVVGAERALLPLVGAFIRKIDPSAKRITVDVPPGLLDGAAEEG